MTAAEGRARLCVDGKVTVGLATYECTGSGFISGTRIVCTSPTHDLPTVPLITGATITIAAIESTIITSFGVTSR